MGEIVNVKGIVKPLELTFIGGYFENGAWPCASSNAVIPNDQMSALFVIVKQNIKRQGNI